MYFSDDRSNRMIFDQVSESYLDARPEYPKELYDDILKNLFGEDSNGRLDNVLEVGSGSGQATHKLSALCQSLDCIEPGINFVKILNTSFKDNSAVTTHLCTFEEFNSDKKFNLIFSGCALHWIPKAIVLNKSDELLKSGGWLAGVWNMPRFEPSIYNIIERVVLPLYPDFEIPRGTKEQIEYFDEGYDALISQDWVKESYKKIYYDKRNLNSEMVLKLIWSYMDLDALGTGNIESVYQQLAKKIQALGLETHTVENCYPFAMAQKR